MSAPTTQKEAHRRNARSLARPGALLLAAGVFYAIAGSWWAVAGFVGGVLHLLLALGFWLLAQTAEEWEPASPLDRPKLWLILANAMSATFLGLLALERLATGQLWRGLALACLAASLAIHFAQDRADRQATAPRKAVARVGPPQEWL